MTQTLMSVVELSRGSMWNPLPQFPPYLLAKPGDPWPTVDTAVYIVFTNSAGSEIGRLDGTPAADAIRFMADPSEVDPIPAGANFEIFLEDLNGPQKIRYGKVIRREVTFPDSLPAQQPAVALRFTDTFPTLGLRSNWIPVLNTVKVQDNSHSTPNALATDSSLFWDKAAVRWDAPLNSDSPRVHVQMLNPGGGQTGIICCADQRLSTYLAVIFDTRISHHNLRIVVGSGPITYIDKITPVAYDLVDLEDFTIAQDDVTKKIWVYKGLDPTPLASWTDTFNEVPHGPGYRYLGANWIGSLTSTGPQICSWNAKDDV